MSVRFRVPLPGPFVWYPRRRRPGRPADNAGQLAILGVFLLALGIYFAVQVAPIMLVGCLGAWVVAAVKLNKK